jgi:predicted secreted protein
MTAKGRNILIKANYGGALTTIGGMRSKTITLSRDTVDITVNPTEQFVDSPLWRRLMANLDAKASFSGNGVFIDGNAQKFVEELCDTGLIDSFEFVFENGDSLAGNFQVTSFVHNGTYNEAQLIDMAFESDGELVLTRAGGAVSCPTPGPDCTLATWTARGSTSYATNYVMWDGSQFVGAGNNLGDGGASVRVSSDGSSWTDYWLSSMGSPDYSAVGYNSISGVYCFGNKSGDVYRQTTLSSDTYTQVIPTGANVGERIVFIDYFPHLSLWIAIMDNATVITSSDDGASFAEVYNLAGGYTYSKVVYDGTQLVFVAVPSAGSSFVIVTSTDGASWSAGSSIGTDDGVDIDYDCQLGAWKVCTYNGDVYSTTDLTTGWTSVTVNGGGWFNTIYYSDYIGAWLVGGGDSIFDSINDGGTWNAKTVTAFSPDIYSFADNQSTLYIAGSDPQTNTSQTSVWSNQCTV